MKEEQPTILFNKEKLAKLKQAYNKAVKNNDTIFTFEGGEFLVAYAKYLIEYLDNRFNRGEV